MARHFTGAPARKPGESNTDYYKRLVNTANQRMRTTEKLAKSKPFKNVKKWAYKGAQGDIKRLWGHKRGQKWRFSSSIPLNEDGTINMKRLKAQQNAVLRFLNAPTSTKTGIMEVYENRALTINDKYGTNFTWEDIGKFWNSETARRLSEKYDSDTIMEVLAALEDLKPSDIRNIASTNDKITDDAVLDDTIRDILSDFDLTGASHVFSGKKKDIQGALEEVRKS